MDFSELAFTLLVNALAALAALGLFVVVIPLVVVAIITFEQWWKGWR